MPRTRAARQARRRAARRPSGHAACGSAYGPHRGQHWRPKQRHDCLRHHSLAVIKRRRQRARVWRAGARVAELRRCWVGFARVEGGVQRQTRPLGLASSCAPNEHIPFYGGCNAHGLRVVAAVKAMRHWTMCEKAYAELGRIEVRFSESGSSLAVWTIRSVLATRRPSAQPHLKHVAGQHTCCHASTKISDYNDGFVLRYGSAWQQRGRQRCGTVCQVSITKPCVL